MSIMRGKGGCMSLHAIHETICLFLMPGLLGIWPSCGVCWLSQKEGLACLTVLFLLVTTLFPLSIPEFTQYQLDFPNMVNSGTLVRLSYQTHETEGQTWDFCGFTKVHTKSQDSSELPSLPCQRLSFHFLHRALKYPSLGFSQLFHNKLQLQTPTSCHTSITSIIIFLPSKLSWI